MRSRQEMKNPISNKKRKKEGNVRAHAGWQQQSFVCLNPHMVIQAEEVCQDPVV